jgi:predicted component of type VI protein secretion system
VLGLRREPRRRRCTVRDEGWNRTSSRVLRCRTEATPPDAGGPDPISSTFRLPAAGEVTIGRGLDCQVRIDDVTLSRTHARLVVGDGLVLRDLGSANGCHVGGRQLAPNESISIAPGVVITLGGVTVVVQRGRSSTRLRHVRSHEYYEARIEDECARAEASKTTFSVARIRSAPEGAVKTESVLARWHAGEATRNVRPPATAQADALNRAARSGSRCNQSGP